MIKPCRAQARTTSKLCRCPWSFCRRAIAQDKMPEAEAVDSILHQPEKGEAKASIPPTPIFPKRFTGFSPGVFHPCFSPITFSPTGRFQPYTSRPQTFPPYTFHPHTFHPETFHPEIILAQTFHPETFHPQAFHPQTFHPQTFHPQTFHPYTFQPRLFNHILFT